MRVALDVARGRVDLLRRGEEVLGGVDEEARVEVPDRHLDREVRVRLDRRPVRGEDELGRGHVRRRRDDTHRRGVARSGGDLGAVREGEVGDRRAEVDEVVRGCERGDLAGGRDVLSVVLESSGDEGREKGERGLRIVPRVHGDLQEKMSPTHTAGQVVSTYEVRTRSVERGG